MRMRKSKILSSMLHVACTEEKTNLYRLLADSDEKKSLGTVEV
jgi:hypothetical protein